MTDEAKVERCSNCDSEITDDNNVIVEYCEKCDEKFCSNCECPWCDDD